MKFIKVILFSFFLSISSLAQWTVVPSFPSGPIYDIIQTNDTIYISRSGNGIYKSIDGMITWQQINNGLNTNEAKVVYQILVYNGTLYAATVDGIYKSSNSGGDWVKKSNGITIGPGSIYEVTVSIFEYNGNLFTGAWNGIYRSIDNAENWILSNISGSGIQAKNFTNHNGILFAARENINDPSGYKSLNNGISWEALPSNPLFSVITFFSEPLNLWAGTTHGIYLSTDNGLNWVNRSNGLLPDPYNSSIIRVNGMLVTSLKFGGSGISKSSDEGLNWEDFAQGLPFLSSIEKLIVYNNKIIAATSSGLWQRDVSQVIPVELVSFTALYQFNLVHLNWTTATEINNQGFEIQRLNDSKIEKLKEWIKIGFVNGNGTSTEPKAYSFVDEKLSAGKYQYRLKQIDFNGSFEYSNIIEVDISLPEKFSLEQNYPNPFNPSTKIKFTIPSVTLSGVEGSFVTLKVFDVLGNEIATLVNEEKPAGSYEVEFSTTGGPESSIKHPASGIYFYQLKAGDYLETKKMILMK
jgi:hypothetical protein